MNNVILIGRLARDPDVRGEGEKKSARFTLAVDNWNGKEKGADFISCVAFRKTAENVAQYLTKGSKVAVSGKISTGSYTKQDGTKVYTTDVLVDRVEFVESKKTEQQPAPAQGSSEDFMQIPDDGAEELPWN